MVKEKKITLNGSLGIINYLKQHSPKSIRPTIKGFDRTDDRVYRKTLKNFIFTGNLHTIEFVNVKFRNCEFEGIWGFFCIFKNCEFFNCEFRNCRFSHLQLEWCNLNFERCYFKNVEFDEGVIFNIFFCNCSLSTCNFAGLYPTTGLFLYDCSIEESNFTTLTYYVDNNVERNDHYVDILFSDCQILLSNFHGLNLKNSRFIDSYFYKSGFVDCTLDNECFVNNKEIRSGNYATLDFQTILQSDELNFEILSNYFNIKNNINLKDHISLMTTQKTFSTVFISYSFKDSNIARLINEHLKSAGIRTFIWEKDAPVGKPLEEIMTTGIGIHDKLLFISSQNSIRSKACQFELTTARNKQESTWETIFFPIIIDQYLFEVKKDQIRPIEYLEEYWKNIEEMRRVNALDLSRFNKSEYEENEFKEMIQKVIEGLKIEEKS